MSFKYNKRGKNGCSTHYILDATVTAAIKRYLKYCKDELNDVILRHERTLIKFYRPKPTTILSLENLNLI